MMFPYSKVWLEIYSPVWIQWENPTRKKIKSNKFATLWGFRPCQTTTKLIKLSSCLKQWERDIRQWLLVQQVLENPQSFRFWKKSKEQPFIGSIQNRSLFLSFMVKWTHKPDNGQMVCFQRLLELQMRRTKESKSQDGFCMMVMWTQFGSKTWTVSWTIIGSLLWSTGIESDSKSSVKCCSKFLTSSMLLLLQSVDAVWFT